HGLQRHVAESLGEAREEEEIGGGEMLSEVLAEAQAHKDEVGVLARKACRHRSRADPHKTRISAPFADLAESLDREPQVLLRCDATEINDREPALRDAPAIAQLLAPARGIKQK